MQIQYKKIKTKAEYDSKMEIENKKSSQKIIRAISNANNGWIIDLTNVLDGKNENAYKEACENRRFEIEMYWRRSGYFWAFIVSIYTALFFIGKEGQNILHHNAIMAALAFLGFVFCLGFYFANKGSKCWQENWEQQVNLLENNISGPLYKTFIRNENSYSVSKINDFLCFILCFFSGGFFIVKTVDFLNIHFGKDSHPYQKFGLFLIVLVFTILIFLYMKFCLLGNRKNSKNFDFCSAEIGD